MARINIEEKWWIDPRRSALIREIGDEEKADGAVLKLWRIAQEYWKKGKRGIPMDSFKLLPHSDIFLRCALAEERDSPERPFEAFEVRSNAVRERSVFVRGCSEAFGWLTKKSEDSSLAGKKSAEKRRILFGTAQPQTRTTPERPFERPSNAPNDPEPSSSSSPSTSPSPSITVKKKNNNVGIRVDYPQVFTEAWEAYGRRGDKKAAFEAYKALNLTEVERAKLTSAIETYCKDTEWKFRKHFCRFLKTDWREVTLPNGHDKEEDDRFSFLYEKKPSQEAQ